MMLPQTLALIAILFLLLAVLLKLAEFISDCFTIGANDGRRAHGPNAAPPRTRRPGHADGATRQAQAGRPPYNWAEDGDAA